MNNRIIKRWTTESGYEAVIIERAEDAIPDEPWLTGYVLLPESHPWHGFSVYQHIGSDLGRFVSGTATYSDDHELLIDGFETYDLASPYRLLSPYPSVSFADNVIGLDPPQYGIGFTMNDLHWSEDDSMYMNDRHVTDQLESLARQLKLVEECETLSELVTKLEAAQ